MKMKIDIVDKIEGNNKIIIGTRNSNFQSWITNENEKILLTERLKNDKLLTVSTSGPGINIIQVLARESKEDWLLLEAARKSGNSAHAHIKDYGLDNFMLINEGVSKEEMFAFLEGVYLTDYNFSKYFTKSNSSFCIKRVSILDKQINTQEIEQLVAVLNATSFSRDLVNEPLSYLTAVKMAEEFISRGKEDGFSVEVLNKKKIEALKMGGLLAVNKGSIDPPTFSILEWSPENAVNKKPFVLVGKGVVYDSGGLSLKPTTDSMDYMKSDMGGAAAVTGAISAVAKAKLPVHLIGLIPATDNRPDGNAYVPGDVIKMHDGSTVEVLNTDAEGRMILADALSYARQFDPELVIELSTLTGAAAAAVGNYAIVGMGNAPLKEMSLLKEAGFTTHERIAEFPFWDDFAELLKSDIADQKNIGGRYAGAITAGKFLEKFTNYPFIHLDIAGPAYNKKADNYRGLGGSGVGVRLLFEYFKQKTKK